MINDDLISQRPPVSQAAREKMRQAALGRKHSAATRAKIGASGKANTWRSRATGSANLLNAPVGGAAARWGRRRGW